MAQKIGKREIAALQPHTILWDQEVRGFHARRQYGDAITFAVFYRTQDQQQRWHRIGRFPIFTPTEARREAIRVLQAVALGKDPSGDRQALRSAPTVSELCDEYEKNSNGKKASTIKSDASRITTHIRPKLGKLKVTAVTSEVVENFLKGMSSGSARRNLGLLGAIFSFAVKKGIRDTNPCTRVEKPKDTKRTRRLSDSEYQQLGTALNGGATVAPIAASVIRLLALTGWRSSEAKDLRWSELDLPRQIANLGDTKTGVSVRPLSKVAIEIIEAQPKKDEFVFSYEHSRPISNLRPHWLNLEMPKDVSPHTLRHSLASLAAEDGFAIPKPSTRAEYVEVGEQAG